MDIHRPDHDLPMLWRFGRVQLDERGTVSVGGEALALDRSGFEILLALLRHVGEVVTKDELLAAGWPGRVVSENTLNKAISRLRHALDADGEAIRVVYGYGYRLAAQVHVKAAEVAGAVEIAQADGIDRLRSGDSLPLRPQWRLDRWLGKGASSAVAVGRDAMGEARVFKFAIGETGLRGLRREVALTRYLAEMAVDPAGVVPLLGWNLTRTPFFTEMPFYPDGDLRHWAGNEQRLKSLPQAARLDLCAQVCEAVAELHATGIVHKDLKPDNLYLTADADAPHGWRVLLGDLGAGEAALSPQLAELGLTRSLIGTVDEASSGGGSPLYLAPEVLAGQAATQQSDVYSLGMLLYQLLAGDLRRPLAPGWEADIGEPLLREDIALAAAVEPEHRRIDARGLAQRLRTLDNRLKERQAAAQEAERQRLRDTQLQRLRQRWRWGLAVSLSLFAGFAVALWMFLRAEAARLQAEHDQRRAQAVQTFLAEDLLLKADPFVGGVPGDVSLRQAIDAATETVDTRFASQPESAVEVYHSIAHVYSGWGDYARAIEIFQRARVLAAGLKGRPSAVAEIDLHLCNEMRMAGDVVAAGAACVAARTGFDAAGVRSDETTVAHAKVMFETGDWARAVGALDPVVERTDPERAPRLLADALWFRALSLRKLARYAEADASFKRLMEVQRREYGEESPMTAWALADYGDFLTEVGRFDEAMPALEMAQTIFDGTLGPQHPDSLSPGYSVAEMHLWKGEWSQAIALLEPRLVRWREVLGTQHFWTLYALTKLALAEAEAGHVQKAQPLLDEARAVGHTLLAQYHAKSASFHANWARTFLMLERADDAATELQILEVRLHAHFAPDHPLRATADCLHARLALLRGDRVTAASHIATCRNGLGMHFPAEHPALLEPASLQARLESEAGVHGQ
ncbi:tetratricopeptide repeat protein [Pseudofulvimonas gallinarii]